MQWKVLKIEMFENLKKRRFILQLPFNLPIHSFQALTQALAQVNKNWEFGFQIKHSTPSIKEIYLLKKLIPNLNQHFKVSATATTTATNCGRSAGTGPTAFGVADHVRSPFGSVARRRRTASGQPPAAHTPIPIPRPTAPRHRHSGWKKEGVFEMLSGLFFLDRLSLILVKTRYFSMLYQIGR